jgi:hypothetical protein
MNIEPSIAPPTISGLGVASHAFIATKSLTIFHRQGKRLRPPSTIENIPTCAQTSILRAALAKSTKFAVFGATRTLLSSTN